MVRVAFFIGVGVATGLVVAGCPIGLPPNCQAGCPAGQLCGTDGYCHPSDLFHPDGGGSSSRTSGSSGATSSGASSSGTSGGSTSTGGSSTSSSTNGTSSGASSTNGTSSSGSSCTPQGPADGGLTPRYGLAAVFVGGHLIFALGGLDSCRNYSYAVEVYDTENPRAGWQSSSTGDPATNVPDLPALAGTSFLSAVGIDSKVPDGGLGPWGLVVIGGKNEKGDSNLTEAFAQGGQLWEAEGALPEAVDGAAAVVDGNGCVDLIGGLAEDGGSLTGTPTASIETLCQPFSNGNVAGSSWTTNRLPLPSPIAYEAVAQDANLNSYVLGGIVPGVETSTAVYVIDSMFSTVSTGLQTNLGHCQGGAAFSGTNLYAIGGQSFLIGDPQSAVEVLELSSQFDWGTAPSLNLARSSFATVTDGSGNIYVIGGIGGPNGTTVFGSMEVLNPGATSWTLVP